MLRLKAAGHRVVLVLATGGELGLGSGDTEALLRRRMSELRRSANLLAVDSLIALGYHDSGMRGDPANMTEGSFWSTDTAAAAEALAVNLDRETVDSLVVYDRNGIYGHPDHVKCHSAGLQAAQMTGITSTYEMTVDREYLHFVETHLVTEAASSEGPGLDRSEVGYSTAEIDLPIDVRGVIETKRRAMAAHTSQLPGDAPVFRLDPKHFVNVYGWEWYVRTGTRGALDDIA